MLVAFDVWLVEGLEGERANINELVEKIESEKRAKGWRANVIRKGYMAVDDRGPAGLT
jgi:uncharacterized protein (UPF0335 family)